MSKLKEILFSIKLFYGYKFHYVIYCVSIVDGLYRNPGKSSSPLVIQKKLLLLLNIFSNLVRTIYLT